jgi:oligoendopeptidase F
MTEMKLPHWNLTTIFPSLETAPFQESLAALEREITKLEAVFDAGEIMLRATPPALDATTVERFETALTQLNEVSTHFNLLRVYLLGFISTDSRNTTAQQRLSELQQQQMRLQKLQTRFTAWIGSLDVDGLLARSELAREHSFALRKARVSAEHLMSPTEEALATELNVTGGQAWAKLYNNVSSQITAEIELDGESQTLPMSALRNLAHDVRREVRQRAYEVELATWEQHAMPIAAALNSIKGQTNTLLERRGWESPLAVALHNNNIDRATLETMLTTAESYFPTFERYLQAKARLLGVERLAWCDLFAPVGESQRTWDFETARAFILENFRAFSDRLGDMAERAFRDRWIDAEPRDGKRGGAFCAWVRADESRILANFQPAYSGMGTLAHELGHAYHNLARANRTYIQRQTPMTLAETASNFCEIMMRDAALSSAPPAEELAIIEASLQDACQVVVDITSRYLFEKAVFERRRARELAVEELNAIMLESQRAAYGAGLDGDQLHPYMWAAKPHYYGSIFYNFPYMFGLLFSLGLYARYQETPEAFLAEYDDLLSATGMADAATLAARYDIDLHDPAFWRSSLDLIVADVDRFVALVDEQT